MAEFCADCAKKHLGFTDEEMRRAVMSDDPELCEGCGEIKPVVEYIKPTLMERFLWAMGI